MMRRLPFLLGIMLLFSLPAQGRTEEPLKAVPEYTMKAAYLYNFAQLTDWPTEPGGDGTFNLCVFGQDEFGGALDALRGKMVNNRPLRLHRIADAADAQQCHLLFVGETDGNRGTRLFEALREISVLTVTDDNQNIRASAILLQTTAERRLTFQVNLDVAKRAQLKFSSKLLRLARKVIGQ